VGLEECVRISAGCSDEKVMELRIAENKDRERVLQLYDSVRGKEFCPWNQEYPVMREIDGDTAADCLFLFIEGKELIGALSVEPENELDDKSFWRCKGKAAEIARVVVAPEHQGKGIAVRMMEMIEARLKREGYDAIHLLVAEDNLPAWKTYEKTGFSFLDRIEIYGGKFRACEKII